MVWATAILLDPLVAVCVIEDVAVASSRPVTATAPERAAPLLGSYTTRWDSKSLRLLSAHEAPHSNLHSPARRG